MYRKLWQPWFPRNSEKPTCFSDLSFPNPTEFPMCPRQHAAESLHLGLCGGSRDGAHHDLCASGDAVYPMDGHTALQLVPESEDPEPCAWDVGMGVPKWTLVTSEKWEVMMMMMRMRRQLITVNTTTIILAMIIDGAGTCGELGMMAARFGRACWMSCGKADSPHPRKFWVPMVPKPLGRTSRWGRSLRDAHLRLATRLLADHANPVYTLHCTQIMY